jgi:3-phosphoshikimate 1-carboxyvinyltransferase
VLFRSARVERWLSAIGAPIESSGPFIALTPSHGAAAEYAGEYLLSGDAGLSWTILGAAIGLPNSDVTLRGVNVDTTQSGTTESLRDAGGQVGWQMQPERLGQATADLRVTGTAPARCLTVAGERAVRSAASLPCLAALACACPIGSRSLLAHPSAGAAQKAQTAATLARFGVESEVSDEGLIVSGAGIEALSACQTHAEGDADIAMMATVLALRASGPSRVHGAEGIALQFPRFVATLRALGARIDVHETPAP